MKDYKITEKKQLTHNTFIFSVEPLDKKVPSVTISSFFYIYHPNGSKRPYTPIEITDTKLVFVIKVYPQGLLSQYLNSCNINDIVILSDIVIKRKYLEKEHKDILLIAGGTGITPMLQLMNDTDNFSLIFCNLTMDDIFLEDRIKIKVKKHHVIENLGIRKGNYYGGRITKEIVEDVVKIEDTLLCDYVYVCGPPGFMECVCGPKKGTEQGELSGILKAIGFKKEQVFKF